MIKNYFILERKINELSKIKDNISINKDYEKIKENTFNHFKFSFVHLIYITLSLLLQLFFNFLIENKIKRIAPNNFDGDFFQYFLNNSMDFNSLLSIVSFDLGFILFLSSAILLFNIFYLKKEHIGYLLIPAYSIIAAFNVNAEIIKFSYVYYINIYQIYLGGIVFVCLFFLYDYIKIHYQIKKINHRYKDKKTNDTYNNEYHSLKLERSILFEKIKHSNKAIEELLKIKYNKDYQQKFLLENHINICQIDELISKIKQNRYSSEEDELKTLLKINKNKLINT